MKKKKKKGKETQNQSSSTAPPPSSQSSGASALRSDEIEINHSDKLEVGRIVDAYWKKSSKLYPGYIDAVNEDGTFDIQYFDGDYEKNVSSTLIKPQVPRAMMEEKIMKEMKVMKKMMNESLSGDGSSTGSLIELVEKLNKKVHEAIDPLQNTNGDLPADDEIVRGRVVQAYWKKSSKLYPGYIDAVNDDGTFHIQYFDGDYEKNVSSTLIKPLVPAVMMDKKHRQQVKKMMKMVNQVFDSNKNESPAVLVKKMKKLVNDIVDSTDSKPLSSDRPSSPSTPGNASSKPNSSPNLRPDEIVLGRVVDAYWKNAGRLYGGYVDFVNEDGTFDIQYFDGDYEWNVPAKLIKPRVPAVVMDEGVTAKEKRGPDASQGPGSTSPSSRNRNQVDFKKVFEEASSMPAMNEVENDAQQVWLDKMVALLPAELTKEDRKEKTANTLVSAIENLPSMRPLQESEKFWRYEFSRLGSFSSDEALHYRDKLSNAKESGSVNLYEILLENLELKISQLNDKKNNVKLELQSILWEVHTLLGRIFLFGSSKNGVKRDFDSAKHHLKLAASNGHPVAQRTLALLPVLSGGGGSTFFENFENEIVKSKSTKTRQAESLLQLNFSALANDPQALLALGYRHLRGRDVPKSCVTASHYYREAAWLAIAARGATIGGSSRTIDRNRLLSRRISNWKVYTKELTSDAFEYQAVVLNDHVSLAALGELWSWGAPSMGLESDYEVAEQYLRQAAEQMNSNAMVLLGRLLSVTPDTKASVTARAVRRQEKIEREILEKENLENKNSQNSLTSSVINSFTTWNGFVDTMYSIMNGSLIEMIKKELNETNTAGNGKTKKTKSKTNRKKKKSLFFSKESPELNFKFLGGNFTFGSDRLDEAVDWFLQAEQFGNADALRELGALRLYGKLNVKEKDMADNISRARKLLTTAASKGNADAWFDLGLMRLSGIGMRKSFPAALKMFSNGALLKHPFSIVAEAEMKILGLGKLVKSPVTEKKEDIENEMNAQCHLHIQKLKKIAEEGEWGLTQLREARDAYLSGDNVQAQHLYIELAQQGYEVAQANAAYMLTHRSGGAVFSFSGFKAFGHFLLAASKGAVRHAVNGLSLVKQACFENFESVQLHFFEGKKKVELVKNEKQNEKRIKSNSTVWCGGTQRAKSCSLCPSLGENLCAGDCSWEGKECVNGESLEVVLERFLDGTPLVASQANGVEEPARLAKDFFSEALHQGWLGAETHLGNMLYFQADALSSASSKKEKELLRLEIGSSSEKLKGEKLRDLRRRHAKSEAFLLYRKAFEHFKRAAERRDDEAAFNVALMHHIGVGVPQNIHLAKGWYHKAFQFGRMQGQRNAWWPAQIMLFQIRVSHAVRLTAGVIRRHFVEPFLSDSSFAEEKRGTILGNALDYLYTDFQRLMKNAQNVLKSIEAGENLEVRESSEIDSERKESPADTQKNETISQEKISIKKKIKKQQKKKKASFGVDADGQPVNQYDRVRARWLGGQKFWNGFVDKVNTDGTFDIQYDDNDYEVAVAAQFVKLDKTNNKKDDSFTSLGEHLSNFYGLIQSSLRTIGIDFGNFTQDDKDVFAVLCGISLIILFTMWSFLSLLSSIWSVFRFIIGRRRRRRDL
eukprot:g5551.t1